MACPSKHWSRRAPALVKHFSVISERDRFSLGTWPGLGEVCKSPPVQYEPDNKEDKGHGHKVEPESFSFVGRSFQCGEFYVGKVSLGDTDGDHMDRPGDDVYHNNTEESTDNTSDSDKF